MSINNILITPECKLDIAMPIWHCKETHSIKMPKVENDVMKTIKELTWSDVPFFRKTINLFSFGNKKKHTENVLELFTTSGLYEIIHFSKNELLMVGILPMGNKNKTLELGDNKIENFQKMGNPKTVKVAMNFLLHNNVLITETRNLPTDNYARIFFTIYWSIIRFGSGLIRKSWLKGIRNKVLKNIE